MIYTLIPMRNDIVSIKVEYIDEILIYRGGRQHSQTYKDCTGSQSVLKICPMRTLPTSLPHITGTRQPLTADLPIDLKCVAQIIIIIIKMYVKSIQYLP